MKDIILQSAGIRAHVNAFGAELKGLEMNGVEYLYSGDPAYYGRTSPTLFPVVGRFLSDTYFVGDQPFQMPPSGFAMNRNFEIHAQGEDYVCFLLRDDERTRRMYPYPFALYVEYRLKENRMCVTFRVENTGDTEMPFCVGLHTAYRWPLLKGEKPEDYYLRFEKEENLTSFNPFNWKCPGFIVGKEKPLSHELFRNFTRSLTGIQSDWVEYANHVNGHAVRIHRSEMPYMAIWTLPEEEAEYICLEPCTSVHAGASTTMYDRMGVIVLPAGETCERHIEIELR